MPKSSRASDVLLHPWKSLRRWLKRIERQSANRRGGPWTRATEYALILALPVAGALSLLVDEIGVTTSSNPVARIRLGRERIDGPLIGSSIPVDADRAAWHVPVPVMEALPKEDRRDVRLRARRRRLHDPRPRPLRRGPRGEHLGRPRAPFSPAPPRALAPLSTTSLARVVTSAARPARAYLTYLDWGMGSTLMPEYLPNWW